MPRGRFFGTTKAIQAVCTVALFVSCAAPDSLGPARSDSTSQQLKTHNSVSTGGCDQSGPSGGNTASDAFPTCVGFSFPETRQDYATTVGPAAMTEMVWNGESFDDYGESLTDPTCHQTISGVTFNLWVPEYGETATFDVPVPLEKFSNDGSTQFGVPMGSYSLPENMEIWSSSPPGKYSVRGGLLRAVCYDFTVRTPFGVRLEGGWHRWYDYTGVLYLNPGNPGAGGSGRGWSWVSTSTGYQHGGGGGWQVALEAYLDEGRCTWGWEIWVDGLQKCDAFGHAMT